MMVRLGSVETGLRRELIPVQRRSTRERRHLGFTKAGGRIWFQRLDPRWQTAPPRFVGLRRDKDPRDVVREG